MPEVHIFGNKYFFNFSHVSFLLQKRHLYYLLALTKPNVILSAGDWDEVGRAKSRRDEISCF